MHHVQVIRSWGDERVQTFPEGVDWKVDDENTLAVLRADGSIVTRFSSTEWESISTVGLNQKSV